VPLLRRSLSMTVERLERSCSMNDCAITQEKLIKEHVENLEAVFATFSETDATADRIRSNWLYIDCLDEIIVEVSLKNSSDDQS
jgi:hypothetical protein